jgi:cellulose synthase/poly-beta-1,6-N-acetylglucosamine synthase-like glycosyltransferase
VLGNFALILLSTMYFPEFESAGTPEVLTVLAAVAFILVLVDYSVQYLPFAAFRKTHLQETDNPVPVSLIICARNEEDNLREHLPIILEQDHPEYEVIVVNDCSWDNTENVIDGFAEKYPHLRKTTIKEDAYYKHGKKFAMLVGIKAAKHDHLVFTDADCFPSGKEWLRTMARGFTETRKIVLGYGAYQRKQGFLNRLIRFDSFGIATRYLSAAIKGRPYMGVGRNLGYTHSLFFSQRGFSRHYHIISGDDDLFVNHAATDSNTNICVSPEAITYSEPETSFRAWRLQKARHLTTAPLYTARTKSFIAFHYFTQYFFVAMLIALAFHLNTALIIPVLLLLKSTALWIVLRKPSSRLKEQDLWAAAPVYELALLFIYPIFQSSKLFYKPERWTS